MSSSNPPSLQIGSTLGHFVLKKLLGEGGMGMVFLGEDQNLSRRVALKVMQPEFARQTEAKLRFLREAKLAASIESERIVRIYEVGEDGGVPFIAMELLIGETLHDFLERERIPPVATTIKIVGQVLQGLAVAHQQGLIHRDIKPANIWLETVKEKGKFRCKILDFGLARSDDGDGFKTQSGIIVGTLHYMSFEQLDGKPLDARTDLYSVGVMLYQMLTGNLPFPGNTVPQKVVQMLSGKLSRPTEINPRIPPPLADFTLKLLAKDPNDRPYDANEVIETLEAIVKGTHAGPITSPVPFPPVAAKPKPRGNAPVRQMLEFDDEADDATEEIYPRREIPRTPMPRPQFQPQPPPADPNRLGGDMFEMDTVEDRKSPSRPRRRFEEKPASGNLLLIPLLLGLLLLIAAIVILIMRDRNPDPVEDVARKPRIEDDYSPPRKIPDSLPKPPEKEIDKTETEPSVPNEKKAPKTTPPMGKKDPLPPVISPNPKKEPPPTPPEPKKEPPPPSDPKTDFPTGIGEKPSLLDCLGPRGADNLTVQESQKLWADYLGVSVTRTLDLGDGVRMEFVLIPPGRFFRGSTPQMIDRYLAVFSTLKRDRFKDEEPQQQVKLSKPFYLAKTEVTRRQFERFVLDTGHLTAAEKGSGGFGYNPTTKVVEGPNLRYNWCTPGWKVDGTHPAVNLSWQDCRELSKWVEQRKENFPKGFSKIRLPTEAEWEFACRAGTRTWYPNGSDDPESLAKIGNVGDGVLEKTIKNWSSLTIRAEDGHAFTCPVGNFPPNAFGLMDMVGNVAEWCEDGYDPKSYQTLPEENPIQKKLIDRDRIIRGGSWRKSPIQARSGDRNYGDETGVNNDLGCRLVIGFDD